MTESGPEPSRDPSQAVRDILCMTFDTPFKWVDIPAGSVTLEGNLGTHQVEAFQMARYCITNAQFDAFVDDGYAYGDGRWWSYCDAALEHNKKGYDPADATYPHVSNPRVNVTWYEAVAFCLWLSNRTGQNIMLPTEQQWQRAGQGDDRRAYAWGNGRPSERLVNWNKHIGESQYLVEHVDSHHLQAEKQPYGLYNMTGNVDEWCLTDYHTGAQDIKLMAEGRVVRGGSWNTKKPEYLRLAFRNAGPPQYGYHFIGFRIARLL
ncbi:MAG: SUMF1/EgtB/PvdO family nonheme iron enzyme [Anaerolineae bacterium]|nr:SUMF1/EgtB/PvdO family nonheme iron enzyme [Anaerolineae bacterium]